MGKLVDANFIIRYFVEDDVIKASRIEKSLKEGKEKFFITDVTISEVVWVLHSFYNLSKSEIVNKVEGLLNLVSIELDREVISKALEFFRIYNIDWIDAYLAAYSKVRGDGEVYSYDRDLDKVLEIIRKEP